MSAAGQFHYSLPDLKILAQSIRIHSLSQASPATTSKWSTTAHLTSTRRLPRTPAQLHRTLPDATNTPQSHLNTPNAANSFTPTRGTPLRDSQPLTPTRPRFLQPPSLDNSQDPLEDTDRDKALHPRSFHYTPFPENVPTPESAEHNNMIGHVTATSPSSDFDNRGSIRTSLAADSPLGQIRSLALNMTHTDPFGGGGWVGRVPGHTTGTHLADSYSIDPISPTCDTVTQFFDTYY